MKKTGLFFVALVCVLTLAGCKFNCPQDELSEVAQYCLDNSGTYSHVISQDEEYGECSFPSGVACRDDILINGQCDFEPNLDDIDTEEERLAGCEENVNDWMEDFEKGAEELIIEWGEESEAGASFVRNGTIKYIKDGYSWTMNAECVADFVDGSLTVSYDEAVAGEPVEMVEEEISEENLDNDAIEEIVIEEISEETIENEAEPAESEEAIEENVVE